MMSHHHHPAKNQVSPSSSISLPTLTSLVLLPEEEDDSSTSSTSIPPPLDDNNPAHGCSSSSSSSSSFHQRCIHQLDRCAEAWSTSCGDCCGSTVPAAALNASIINLIFFILKYTFFVVISRRHFHAKPSIQLILYLMYHYSYQCFAGPMHQPSVWLIMAPSCIVIAIVWVADAVFSVVFLIAVVSNFEVESRSLICDMFTWFNFLYPFLVLIPYLYFFIADGILKRSSSGGGSSSSASSNLDCAHWSAWLPFLLSFPFLVWWVLWNALVGRAFRNQLELRSRSSWSSSK